MAEIARASITLSSVVDVEAAYRYYLLQSSTLNRPSVPTDYPPGGAWQLAEPDYDSSSTLSLYYVDLTLFSDGSFQYGEVNLSSSYEAAKGAYNEAMSAAEQAKEALDTVGLVQSSLGELSHRMESDYLAVSDFGLYKEQIKTEIEASARQVVESYGYAELIAKAEKEAGDQAGKALNAYMTQIDGQIRRGYLTDQDSGELVFGIAISQTLQFTGTELTEDGTVYYELKGEQTLGLYTSTGWQFWAGGKKIGWFNAEDNRLHVGEMVSEESVQFGSDWMITLDGGWGLRYIGG